MHPSQWRCFQLVAGSLKRPRQTSGKHAKNNGPVCVHVQCPDGVGVDAAAPLEAQQMSVRK